MKTIEKGICSQLEIKKSKFITILIPLVDDDVTIHLDRIKEDYPNASHYCYAYRFMGKSKCSDDKEPSKTAGMPILNVLEKEDIDCCLCVVVRYFGGIKLGAGGLVRAYSEAASSTLRKANIVNLTDGYLVEVTFSYSQEKDILYLLRDSTITTKEYRDQITYCAMVSEEVLESLMARGISYQILKKTKIRG